MHTLDHPRRVVRKGGNREAPLGSPLKVALVLTVLLLPGIGLAYRNNNEQCRVEVSGYLYDFCSMRTNGDLRMAFEETELFFRVGNPSLMSCGNTMDVQYSPMSIWRGKVCKKAGHLDFRSTSVVRDPKTDKPSGLRLHYEQGDLCTIEDGREKKYSVTFTLECARGNSINSPYAVEKVGCDFNLKWKTRSGCYTGYGRSPNYQFWKDFLIVVVVGAACIVIVGLIIFAGCCFILNNRGVSRPRRKKRGGYEEVSNTPGRYIDGGSGEVGGTYVQMPIRNQHPDLNYHHYHKESMSSEEEHDDPAPLGDIQDVSVSGYNLLQRRSVVANSDPQYESDDQSKGSPRLPIVPADAKLQSTNPYAYFNSSRGGVSPRNNSADAPSTLFKTMNSGGKVESEGRASRSHTGSFDEGDMRQL